MSNQLPGPDMGGAEAGFDAIGQDFRDLAPRDPDTHNDQLPGGDGAEIGWVYGIDMRDMADGHPMEIPQGSNMGVVSDDGSMVGDVAQSAGFRVIGDFDRSNTEGVLAGDIVRVFDDLEANAAGAWDHAGAVPGMDSMSGLPLGSGSGTLSGPGQVAYAAGEPERGSQSYPGGDAVIRRADQPIGPEGHLHVHVHHGEAGPPQVHVHYHDDGVSGEGYGATEPMGKASPEAVVADISSFDLSHEVSPIVPPVMPWQLSDYAGIEDLGWLE